AGPTRWGTPPPAARPAAPGQPTPPPPTPTLPTSTRLPSARLPAAPQPKSRLLVSDSRRVSHNAPGRRAQKSLAPQRRQAFSHRQACLTASRAASGLLGQTLPGIHHRIGVQGHRQDAFVLEPLSEIGV